MNHNVEPSTAERIIWQGYPSWWQFMWLHFFSLLTAFRGVLLFHNHVAGWKMWVGGSALLLGVTALLRRWVLYRLTPTELIVRNGYTGSDIDRVKLEKIQSLTCEAGPLFRFWGIGTVVVGVDEGGERRIIRLRGLNNPEVVEAKIKALPLTHLRPKSMNGPGLE